MKKHGAVWVGIALALAAAVAGLFYFSSLGGRANALRDKNPAVRAAALRDGGRDLGTQLLLEALHDEDADVRLLAAQRLGGSGPDTEKRTAALLLALKDPHAGVRREAAEALSFIGPAATPALCKALEDEDPRVRVGAAFALIGPAWSKERREWAPGEKQVVVPLLEKALQDPSDDVRRAAAQSLGGIHRRREPGEGSEP
jgi:HEAT repeat protein